MKHCGLLGRKLGHSYSPAIHADLGDYSYRLFEKEPDELEDFLRNGGFDAINVTIPYKKDVIPFLDELSPTAKKLGAVNTIVRRPDGKLIGHNTDYYGFRSMLEKSALDCRNKKVLVLGSGGASVTICAVLEEAGALVTVISRTGDNNYQNLHLHQDAAVIVNTTPVGMYPNTNVSPLDLSLFPRLEGVLDIIYNPARTKLLLDAEARELVTMNGLWMLVAQAKEAAEWFTGEAIADNAIEAIHASLRRRMENGRSVCTLKTPLPDGSRGEWELECDDILTAIPRLCALGAPEELIALAAPGLSPSCGARFTRTARKLVAGGTMAELALDTGVLGNGEIEEAFAEVEVELKSGDPEAAVAFGLVLKSQFGLTPEEKSKFRRALDLAQGG